MKIAIIYLHVVGRSDATAPPPEYYRPWSTRFYESYQKFRGTVEHELRVVCCGGSLNADALGLFTDCIHFHEYRGGGWDIGAYQHAMKQLQDDFDFVINMATPTYFWREGFIESIVRTRNQFGDGLYGPTASFENSPHIRTCCFACDPKTFAKYPMLVDSRAATFAAESGADSITNWYRRNGYPVKLVACDGVYAPEDWRKPANIFRRGDQTNCFIRDRHTDWFETADPGLKIEFASRADNGQGI